MSCSRSLEKLFHLAKLKLYTHQTTHFLPPVLENYPSKILTTLHVSHKWIHADFVFLWLANFTYHNFLNIFCHLPIPWLIPTLFFFFFLLFRAPPTAHGGSQAAGGIGAVAASLHHSHSNSRSLTHWARPGIKSATSWFLARFISAAPRRKLPWRPTLSATFTESLYGTFKQTMGYSGTPHKTVARIATVGLFFFFFFFLLFRA